MSERYDANPNTLGGADAPHAARYYVARGFLRPDDLVVDCACGTGYGSYMLADNCAKVLAVDKNDTFQQRWKKDNITFLTANVEDIEEYPICDVWVTLETIEHLKEPAKYIDKICDKTRRMIIISSPNKHTAGLNEFHLHDVLITNARQMMGKHFMDWQEYHSFLQGDYYILIYVRKDTKLIG